MPRPSQERLTRLRTWFSAANPLARITGYVPKEEYDRLAVRWHTFVFFGLILTTGLAGFSGLIFATQVYGAGATEGIAFGFVWSVAILIVDLLILNQPAAVASGPIAVAVATAKSLLLITMRLSLALVVALLVAEPLTLWLFSDAITKQVSADVDRQANVYAARRLDGATTEIGTLVANSASMQEQIWALTDDLDGLERDAQKEYDGLTALGGHRLGSGSEHQGIVAAAGSLKTKRQELVQKCSSARDADGSTAEGIAKSARMAIANERERLSDPKNQAYLTQQAALDSIAPLPFLGTHSSGSVSAPSAGTDSTESGAQAAAQAAAARLGDSINSFPSCGLRRPQVEKAGGGQQSNGDSEEIVETVSLFSLREREVIGTRRLLLFGALVLVDLIPLTLKYLGSSFLDGGLRDHLQAQREVSISSRKNKSLAARKNEQWKDAIDLKNSRHSAWHAYWIHRLQRIKEMIGFVLGRSVPVLVQAGGSEALDLESLRAGQIIGSWTLDQPLPGVEPRRDSRLWLVRSTQGGLLVMKVVRGARGRELEVAQKLQDLGGEEPGATRDKKLITIVDSGRIRGSELVYIVSEFFPDGSLLSYYDRRNVRSLREGMSVVESTLQTLRFVLRGAGIHHGDVSPGNILVSVQSGQGFLTDWGMAFDRIRLDGGGTPLFVAPEVYSGRSDLGPWGPHLADLYGVAATFYWYVTGIPPYLDQIHAHLIQDTPDAISRYIQTATGPTSMLKLMRTSAGIPTQLDSVVLRWLSPNPKDRMDLEVLFEQRSTSPLTLAWQEWREQMEWVQGDPSNKSVGPGFRR